MKRREFVGSAVGLLAGCCTLEAIGHQPMSGMRRWQDITGKYSVIAKFIDLKDGQVRLWTEDGRPISVPLAKLCKADQRMVQQLGQESLDEEPSVTLKLRRRIDAHQDGVNALAFYPDGKTLAIGGMGMKGWEPPGPNGNRPMRSGGLVELWDTATGKKISALDGHQGNVESLAFSPDGKTLASGGHEKSIRLWDTQAGALKATLQGETACSLSFSPDGKTLAAASWDSALLLNVEGGLVRQAKLPLANHIQSVAISPNGALLAASGGAISRLPGLIVVWSAHGGEPLLKLKEPGPVPCIAFSPNGKTLASGCRDGTVKFWDVRTK